jgi:NAD(P)H-flavin reductase
MSAAVEPLERAGAGLPGLALPELRPDPMLPRLFRVERVRAETRDTVTLELAPEDGPPVVFAPGQFNMLYLFGVGEVAISISGDPGRPSPLTHTLRAVGAVTRGLCSLKPGDAVGVRGPFGAAWPLPEAEGSDVVIVAGGIGLAPLRPAVYHLLAHRERYGRVVVLSGARSPRELLFRRELERWRGRFDLEVAATVDYAAGEWNGQVGVVTTLIPRAGFDPSQTVAMTCGPEVMMRFTVRELEKRGVAPERIFVSMERNMKCAVGFCGHCQYGPHFVCKDGPVFRFPDVARLFEVREA